MAPKVPKKPLKLMEKIEKPISKVKKSKKKSAQNFSSYIYKVLRTLNKHNNIGISAKSMLIMNNLVADAFERIAAEAGRLVSLTKKSSLGSKEIQTAVKLQIPGQLGQHATLEGIKAVTVYYNSNSQGKPK